MKYSPIQLSILKYIMEFTDDKYLEGTMAAPCYNIFVEIFKEEASKKEIKTAIEDLIKNGVISIYGFNNYLRLEFGFEISDEFEIVKKLVFKDN